MNYYEKLRDPRWQRRRLEIMQRDDFTCRDCTSKDGTLNVHHCAYVKGDPWNAPGEVLLTVCEVCHKIRQAAEDEIKLKMGQILAQIDPPLVKWLLESIRLVLSAPHSPLIDNGPFITTQDNFEYHSDMRWFQVACECPAMRPYYDALTKSNTNWKAMDEAIRSRTE